MVNALTIKLQSYRPPRRSGTTFDDAGLEVVVFWARRAEDSDDSTDGTRRFLKVK